MSSSRSHTESKELPPQKVVVAAAFSGTLCSWALHPWDRALYLAVAHDRPFLSIANFRNPYHGFTQTVIQRSLSIGSYFALQKELKINLYPCLRRNTNEVFSQFCIGSVAGSISSILTNGFSAIKYYTWQWKSPSLSTSICDMWRQGGMKPFFNGIKVTMGRDLVFGSTYEVFRHFMREQLSTDPNEKHLRFACNSASAALATVASSPLNYARNIQYGTHPKQIPTPTIDILKNVWHESKWASQSRLSFFQQKFQVGWGTARMGVGVAAAQGLFDATCSHLKKSL